MQDGFDVVRRLAVRRRLGRFNATALIHRHVNDHRRARHVFQHIARDKFRSRRARHQHRAQHQVRNGYRFRDGVGVRSQRLDAAAEDVIEIAQPFEVAVNDDDGCAYTDGHLCGIRADDTAADDGDTARRNARHAAQQHAAPAVNTFQIKRADLHGHAARYFAHGRQQRQVAQIICDRFIGHAGDPAVDHRFG